MAEANLDCQVDCQAEGYVECTAELEGGCEAACQSPEGALFCDGQYIDHGGNLENCVAALEAALSIEVDTSATGMATSSCSNGSCEADAEGEAEVNCAFTPLGLSQSGGAGFLSLLVLGVARLSRRRSPQD